MRKVNQSIGQYRCLGLEIVRKHLRHEHDIGYYSRYWDKSKCKTSTDLKTQTLTVERSLAVVCVTVGRWCLSPLHPPWVFITLFLSGLLLCGLLVIACSFLIWLWILSCVFLPFVLRFLTRVCVDLVFFLVLSSLLSLLCVSVLLSFSSFSSCLAVSSRSNTDKFSSSILAQRKWGHFKHEKLRRWILEFWIHQLFKSLRFL